jgi:hypothetical protein
MRQIYQNTWISLCEGLVERPDGGTTICGKFRWQGTQAA